MKDQHKYTSGDTTSAFTKIQNNNGVKRSHTIIFIFDPSYNLGEHVKCQCL